MIYRVEITNLAFAEIEEAYDWIAERAPSAALRWRDLVLDAIASLERFPNRCGLAPEAAFLGKQVRQMLYGKRGGVYRILFEVRGDTVFVLRVRHSARRFLTDDANDDGG